MSLKPVELERIRRLWPNASLEDLETVHDLVCQDGCGAVLGTRTHVPKDHWRLQPGNSGVRCADCYAALGPLEAARVAQLRAEEKGGS